MCGVTAGTQTMGEKTGCEFEHIVNMSMRSVRNNTGCSQVQTWRRTRARTRTCSRRARPRALRPPSPILTLGSATHRRRAAACHGHHGESGPAWAARPRQHGHHHELLLVPINSGPPTCAVYFLRKKVSADLVGPAELKLLMVAYRRAVQPS